MVCLLISVLLQFGGETTLNFLYLVLGLDHRFKDLFAVWLCIGGSVLAFITAFVLLQFEDEWIGFLLCSAALIVVAQIVAIVGSYQLRKIVASHCLATQQD